MSPAVAFHTQVASIMEVLANAAVAEICELLDGGYSLLQQEITRSRKENEALRRKLRLMELKTARANAMRAVSAAAAGNNNNGSSLLASSRAARAQQQPAVHRGQNHPGQNHQHEPTRRTPGGLLLPRSSSQLRPRGGAAEPSANTGQRKPAVEPARLKTPVIKEEKEEEVWTNTEQDKGFGHAVDGQTKESTAETEAPPAAATKQEVAEQDGGGGGSCSWASGEVIATPLSAPKNLPANKRPEDNAGVPEPVGYDCIMYELQLQHDAHDTQNPLSDDPSCSYSLNTSVSNPTPSDTGNSFPFAISEATHPLPEHQQPAVFPDARQMVPLPPDEPQIPVRKETAAVANAFIMREGWQSQDDFGGGASYSRDDPGSGRTFVCSFCGKTLACLKNLKTHMRVHTGEKPFSCALCGKRFSDSSNLKRHQSVHTGEKRYGCIHCGKRFAQSGSLKVHMSVHTGCKQFRCPHCSKTFISANHLRRHVSTHTGGKQLPPAFQ